MARTRRDRWGIFLTLLAVSIIAWFTLRSSPEDAEAAARNTFLCIFPCGNESLRDIILNVILFVPLGLGLGLWLPAWRAWLLTVFATCAIEFTQYGWLVGRDASLRDILTNSLGGAIGVALVSRWHRVLLPDPVRSRRLAAAAGCLWILLTVGSAQLIRPDLPESLYWGQWAPDLGQFDRWTGQLLDVHVGDLRMPDGRIAESGPFRDRLLADSAMVVATIVTAAAPARFAPIASIFDGEQREIFLLGQRGRDLGFSIRTGLSAIELRGQFAVLRGAFTGQPGESLEVRGGVVRGNWVLSTSGRAGEHRVQLPFSASQAWSGLTPFPLPIDSNTPLIDGLWIGALLFPIGYWLGRATASAGPILAAILAAAFTLGLANWSAQLPLPAGPEWAGIVVGTCLGWMIGRKTPRIAAIEGASRRRA